MISNVVEFKPVIPKSYKRTYQNQQYQITYNPNAREPNERWQWKTIITNTYTQYGNAATQEAAEKTAKKFIDITENKKVVN